jgi:hypothetical protein
MSMTVRHGWREARVRRAAASLLLAALVATLTPLAAVARPAEVIVLPGASSAEGIAAGGGATFYSPAGIPGPSRTLELSGPAAAISGISGEVNLNGIQATANGTTLIVAHSANAQLYTVNPATGASARIAGVSVPNVDGIVLEAGRLWAVQNFSNQIARIRLAPDFSSGVVEEVITSDLFQIPTTAARFGSRLAVVNAKFDTGIPPTADQYEVILVRA